MKFLLPLVSVLLVLSSFAEDIEELKEKAMTGDAEAQFNLGEMYATKRKYKEALIWLDKAVEQENLGAMMKLALVTSYGSWGVDVDTKKSEKLIEHAKKLAEGNYDQLRAKTLRYFATYYKNATPPDIETALLLYEMSHMKGDFYSTCRLANLLSSGEYSDSDKSKRLHKKALEMVDAEFANCVKEEQVCIWNSPYAILASSYVGVNDEEVLYWYEKAADNGATRLYLILAEGHTGKKHYFFEGYKFKFPVINFEESIRLLKKGVTANDIRCMTCLADEYLSGEHVSQSNEEAFKLYLKASLLGCNISPYKVARFYLSGAGVIKDEKEALAWLYIGRKNMDSLGYQIENLEERLHPNVVGLALERARSLTNAIERGGANHEDSPSEINTKFTTGTGTLLREGFIITCHHVIENSKTIRYRYKGEDYNAKIINTDASNDIAILKVKTDDPAFRKGIALKFVDEARVAEEVFTLGYPNISIQGAEVKYTEGEISSMSGVGNDARIMQLSVPLQPGNSGGGIFNNSGEFVGLAVAVLDKIETYKQSGNLPENVSYGLKGDYVEILMKSIGGFKEAVISPYRGFSKPDMIQLMKENVVLIIAE